MESISLNSVSLPMTGINLAARDFSVIFPVPVDSIFKIFSNFHSISVNFFSILVILNEIFDWSCSISFEALLESVLIRSDIVLFIVRKFAAFQFS